MKTIQNITKKLLFINLFVACGLAQSFYGLIGKDTGIGINYKWNKWLCSDLSVSYYNLLWTNDFTVNNTRYFFHDSYDFNFLIGGYKALKRIEMSMELGINWRFIKNYSYYGIEVPIVFQKPSVIGYGPMVAVFFKYILIKHIYFMINLKAYKELSEHLTYRTSYQLLPMGGIGWRWTGFDKTQRIK